MMEAFVGMREVHKRIHLLRAAETLTLATRDEQTRIGFLSRLEQNRWSGIELNELEFGLALEIDVFFQGVRRYELSSISGSRLG